MGMEILAFSSSTPKESFHTRDDYVNGVTVEDLKEIGPSKAYDDHRSLENLIWEQSEKDQAFLIPQTVELNHNRTTLKFDGWGGGSSD